MASGAKGAVTSRAAQAEKTDRIWFGGRLFSERRIPMAVGDIAKGRRRPRRSSITSAISAGSIWKRSRQAAIRTGQRLRGRSGASTCRTDESAPRGSPAIPRDEPWPGAAPRAGRTMNRPRRGRCSESDPRSGHHQGIRGDGSRSENPAVRMTARAATGAIDEVCVFWLGTTSPFPSRPSSTPSSRSSSERLLPHRFSILRWTSAA